MKFKSKIKSKQFIIIIGVALILLVLLIGQLLTKNQKNKKSPIETFEVNEEAPVVFSGQVETKEKQAVFYNEAMGEVEKLSVEDGQIVQVGQELVRYQNKELSSQIKEQERILERTNKNLSQAQNQLKESEKVYSQASSNSNSYEKKVNQLKDQLANQEVAARKAQDEIRKQEQALIENPDLQKTEIQEVSIDPNLSREIEKYTSLQMEAEGRKQESAAKKDSYTAQIDQLKDTKADLEAQLQSLKDKEYQVIKAEISGICKVNQDVLLDASINSPLIEIICEETIVKAMASEYDYEEVVEGKEVTVVPTNSDNSIKGMIIEKSLLPLTSQSPTGQAESSKYPFTVKLDQMLPFGYTVQVQLSSGKIFIPEDFVEENNKQLSVFVVENGVAKKRKIEAEHSEGFYLLKSGLKIKDILVKNSDGSIEEGEHVETNDQPIESQ